MNANRLPAVELAEATAGIGALPARESCTPCSLPAGTRAPSSDAAMSSENVTRHAVGRLAATLGQHEEAKTRLRHAASTNEHTGAHADAAATLAFLGEIVAARGTLAAAKGTLEQARRPPVRHARRSRRSRRRLQSRQPTPLRPRVDGPILACSPG
jgi:hypothetical protein